MNKNNKNSYLTTLCKGFCMGIADIIPGISGGTIALIVGIYEDLINAIKSIDIEFIKLLFKFRFKEAMGRVHWKFLVSVFGGIILAVFTLSKGVSWLLYNHPVYLFAFFFGLVLATIPLIYKLVERWNFKLITIVGIFTVATFYLVQMKPAFSSQSILMIFLSGFIAISAMILPGISGSFILLLLGQYHNILEAINHKDFGVLVFFLGGIIVGLLSIVRLLSWLFKSYHDLTVASILGVIIGSLVKIWPWRETIEVMEGRHGKVIPVKQICFFPENFNVEVLFVFILMTIGFLIAYLLNKMPNKIEVS
jgi:putative membrane protein